MGFLTISRESRSRLCVPNRAVIEQFFECYFQYLRGTDQPVWLHNDLRDPVRALLAGDPEPFVRQVCAVMTRACGNHANLHLKESDMQTALLMGARLETDDCVNAELEVAGAEGGFADLVLANVHSGKSTPSYVFELKRLRKSNASPEKLDEALRQALGPVDRYARSDTLSSMKFLKKVAVVFVGTSVGRISVREHVAR